MGWTRIPKEDRLDDNNFLYEHLINDDTKRPMGYIRQGHPDHSVFGYYARPGSKGEVVYLGAFVDVPAAKLAIEEARIAFQDVGSALK